MMPVTARLSKLFYDRLGDEIANELVEWFNQVDAASRDDLRALNELNWARFDARLEQRTVELRSHADGLTRRLDAKIDAVAQTLDVKIDAVGQTLDAKIDAVAQTLDAKIDTVAQSLEAKTERGLLEVKNELQMRLTEQARWMVLTWGVLLAAVIGLYTR